MTVTWKVTVVEAPGGIELIVKPTAGFAPGKDAPFTVTLFETKVVPFGIGSVNTTLLAVTFPVLVKVIV
ncbi:hypothetical protein NT98_2988 [Bacillus cereus]|nr:hypothetical protein NT98_1464 [Bacillus cereus]EAL11010.1 hypothetical protein protein [Bacillus cereus G9241]AIY77349.1 hypothetical protein NT98_2988 [Bacillus cereus]EAL11011.1 hypothetical protein protein [Bacillus cereus G9241]EAL11013.1 hypothetical protein protein [Bacillus cereus G9241]